MADITPSTPEKTVVVNNPPLGRLWTLTIISLTLSSLIVLLFVVGAIMHLRHKPAGFPGQKGPGGGFAQSCAPMGYGHRFHHFGGMGMGRGWGMQNGFQGPRDRGGRGPGGDFGRGPGGPPPGMPGMRGMMGGMDGMGRMGGMMGGGGGMMGPDKNGPPDPAKMTDGILNHLSTTLSLTDDQKAKIKPIIEQQVADMQKQMEAQRAAVQKQIEDGKAKIKPLLTPDQQKQLDAMPLPGQKPAAPDEAKQPAPDTGR